MSNSIWKTPDQEQEHNEEVLIEYIGITGRPFYIFDEYVRRIPNQKRWCYITDLVAQTDKAERLQKAVDLARERLLSISDGYDIMKADAETIKRLFYAIQDEASETYKEIKQLIKREIDVE